MGAWADPMSVSINKTITYEHTRCDTNRLKIGD